MCEQCGTRWDDWDHGGDDEEDRYTAVTQRCVGCQVIADKQAEAERTGVNPRGLKVALVPVSVQAALTAHRTLTTGRHRGH